jgi:uncharacterized protein (UPF0147 family)
MNPQAVSGAVVSPREPVNEDATRVTTPRLTARRLDFVPSPQLSTRYASSRSSSPASSVGSPLLQRTAFSTSHFTNPTSSATHELATASDATQAFVNVGKEFQELQRHLFTQQAAQTLATAHAFMGQLFAYYVHEKARAEKRVKVANKKRRANWREAEDYAKRAQKVARRAKQSYKAEKDEVARLQKNIRTQQDLISQSQQEIEQLQEKLTLHKGEEEYRIRCQGCLKSYEEIIKEADNNPSATRIMVYSICRHTMCSECVRKSTDAVYNMNKQEWPHDKRILRQLASTRCPTCRLGSSDCWSTNMQQPMNTPQVLFL